METQRDLSRKAVGPPYVHPEVNISFGERQPDDHQRDRANQISRKDDNSQNLKVGLYDIDSAILYYFNEVIRPRVRINGTDEPVPVIFGDPEKWQAIQKDGIYRDKGGKRQIPLIIFKRDEFTRNRRVTSKVDANYPHNFYVTNRGYTARNQYDRFNIIHNRIPEEAYILTVVPDYITLSYSCIILTDLISQMNPIVEAISFASDSYWGDENRFKFQSFIDSFRTEVISSDNDDRVVKTTFTVKMNGYILPDTVNSDPYVNLKRYRKTSIKTSFTEKVVY